MNAVFENKYLACLVWLTFLYACSSSKNISFDFGESKISTAIDTSGILATGFSGLVLYDLEQKKILFQKNEDRYFIPASNTKLFTLYACLKSLGDSIPAFRYLDIDSTFLIWGTSDPTLLHPFFEDHRVADFLASKTRFKPISYADSHVDLQHYGEGWMWDDFNDYYQVELSALPIYGNVLNFHKEGEEIRFSPDIFQDSVVMTDKGRRIKRELHSNIFYLPKKILKVPKFIQDIPYTNVNSINLHLLEKLIGNEIILSTLPITKDAVIFYSFPVDTVYRRMMQVSDNMLAEHLLLAAGMQITDTISSRTAIKNIVKNYLADSPHKMIWIDGAGLSRYNMFTPESILYLLLKMYNEVPEKRLFSLLASGGGSGTLSNVYASEKKSYMFAKSGSMGGVYNLSGYMITKSGKKLAFSFMNNNFSGKVSEARTEVERILELVRTLY